MKDALGHGSNGLHSGGINAIPSRARVERYAGPARTASGQRVANTSVWQKVTNVKRRAVAERIAQLQRVDNPNSRVRIR